MYDASLGRWFNTDPLTEKYLGWSPYNYCFCNPLLFIDLNGEDGLPYFNPFPYTDNWFLNFGKIFPNAATSIFNGGIQLINSFISTGELLWQSGLSGYGSALLGELKWIGNGVVKGWETMYSYHVNTPLHLQLKDLGQGLVSAKTWENVLTLGGSLALGNAFSNIGKINLSTLSNAGKFETISSTKNLIPIIPDGKYYSVAFEMKLPLNLYPGKYRAAHFKAANIALDDMINSDPIFASGISKLGIQIPRSHTGNILGRSPSNWVWHHDINKGIMQLVPKNQHTLKSAFWKTLHPNGQGGFSIWGK